MATSSIDRTVFRNDWVLTQIRELINAIMKDYGLFLAREDQYVPIVEKTNIYTNELETVRSHIMAVNAKNHIIRLVNILLDAVAYQRMDEATKSLFEFLEQIETYRDMFRKRQEVLKITNELPYFFKRGLRSTEDDPIESYSMLDFRSFCDYQFFDSLVCDTLPQLMDLHTEQEFEAILDKNFPV